MARIMANVKSMEISLRLPLTVLEVLQHSPENNAPDSTQSATRTRLANALEQCYKLSRLHIWLYHAEPCTWSIVNERAVLFPFTSFTKISGLDMSFDLRKLHPKSDTPQRHFMESASCPIEIHRRYRQRKHAILKHDGSIIVRYEPDFPVLYGLTDWNEPITAEQLEKKEREQWEAGNDPYQELRDLEEWERTMWEVGDDPL